MKKEAERLLQSAQEMVRKGKIAQAIKELEKYISSYYKNDVRVLCKLGDLYLRKQNKKNAIKHYLAAARILKKDGFYSKAMALLKQILEFDESNLEVIAEKIDLLKHLACNDDARLLQYRLDELKAQAAAQTEKENVEKEKAQRAIAIDAVEVAMGKSQNGDQAATEFLEEMRALMDGDLFHDKPKRKKSKK